MDKDEFFRIQDEECCYNMINYLTDFEWTIQSSIAHSSRNEDLEKKRKSEAEDKIYDSNIGNFNKQASIQNNMIKPYE
jgi:hypothetical protein